MGGDRGPAVVLRGALQALEADPDLRLTLVGPAEEVEPFAAAHDRATAQAATEVIEMGEHPAGAVRAKKDSSIVVGCRLVKEGAADGFFSAGSTGAMTAAATAYVTPFRYMAEGKKQPVRPCLTNALPNRAGGLTVLCDMGANVVPVFSFNAQTCDTRFGSAKDYVEGICDITGNEGIRTICAAEPIGPNNFLDIMVIAPCTGNTAAKLCNGITDTPVLMATKAHMRNGKPLVIAISTNDALGASFKNIGMLMNMKNIYFVPFGQDNCKSKPNSMIAKMELLPDTIEAALAGKQIQPILQTPT